MVASVPVAVVLTAVLALSGALTLVCAPDGNRPMARVARPAMSASMVVTSWTRAGPLALSWQAILLTALAGSVALGREHSVARTLPAAASV